MRTLYIITKFLTLPMAYLKSVWEHIGCVILGLAVEHKECLTMDDSCGHVEHRLARTKPRAVLVCWIPTFIMTLVGLVFFLSGAINLLYLGVGVGVADKPVFFWVYIAMLYLGASALSNCYPMIEDALQLWSKIYKEENENGKKGANIFWKIVLFIPSIITVAGAYLERYCITLLLSLAVIAAGIIF